MIVNYSFRFVEHCVVFYNLPDAQGISFSVFFKVLLQCCQHQVIYLCLSSIPHPPLQYGFDMCQDQVLSKGSWHYYCRLLPSSKIAERNFLDIVTTVGSILVSFYIRKRSLLLITTAAFSQLQLTFFGIFKPPVENFTQIYVPLLRICVILLS